MRPCDLSVGLPILLSKQYLSSIAIYQQDGASPMIIVTPVGAPEPCASERTFLSHVREHTGVLLCNVNVPNSAAPGSFTREVDGVMITPRGIFTTEVKGLAARGVLRPSRMDAWAVVDGAVVTPMKGRPHAQALTHSKYLASFLKDTGVTAGWVQAVLVIAGDVSLPDDVATMVFDNVQVVVSRPGVGDLLGEQSSITGGQQEMSVESVLRLLEVFECTESGPNAEALLAEGFRTDADIEAELEARRRQVREEFLSSVPAHATSTETPAIADDHPPLAGVPVLDAPSTSEWRATAERFAAVTAFDAELTDVGAFVDEVPMHRRLVKYALRKGIDLATVAAVVNTPDEVWGEEDASVRIFCGSDMAVSVRTLDGLAMHFKDLAVAHAETNGAVVGGVEITARAAKAALSHMDLSLEAVARVVTMPQERWFITGTTDVAHARGDVVAVTSGQNGPVIAVQSRAVAVARSAPKPVEEPKVVEVQAGGFTVSASAVNWCRRRRVDLSVIAEVATAPQQVWAGHSPNREVRCGTAYAVLVDVETHEIVSVMIAEEALEYRNGIVQDGVSISGRCLFLARRRKRPVEDLVDAVLRPRMVARAPGAGETVYIGASTAVKMCDETGAALDFTYAEHARSQVAHGELIKVDLPGVGDDSPVLGRNAEAAATSTAAAGALEPRKPTPAMFAAMAGLVPKPMSSGSAPAAVVAAVAGADVPSVSV